MKLTRWDRFTMGLFPSWTLNRIRARAVAEILTKHRHYDAAQPGRRTEGWRRSYGDADLNIRGALIEARMHARDLIRNNGWARRAQRTIATNTVGHGIVPKALSPSDSVAKTAMGLWKAWGETRECESEGRFNFYGLQSLAMKTIAESGEVLFRRRWRLQKDGLTVPFQLQVLESDFLDHSRNLINSQAGGPIIQGVEFDKLGRRAAYWLWPQHPGSGRNYQSSQRIPASDVIHVYYTERPGQSRGISWFVTATLGMKDLDEFEDATLLRQKIAACMAGFITTMDGVDVPLGDVTGETDEDTGALVETFEPGMIVPLPPGKDVKFANPPTVMDDGFSTRNLRKLAAGIGVTYEDMTGDYSQSNFSSARMARISHWANVRDWREHMLIPLMCEAVWDWMIEAAVLAGKLPTGVPVKSGWTAPPAPMIQPEKEGLALQRLVRTGAMTPSEMIRERGGNPDDHLAEYAADLKKLDDLGITLDSDARKTSGTGQEQPSAAD